MFKSIMPHNRRQRFSQGRNLQNLHVIPTLNRSPIVNMTPTLVEIPQQNQRIILFENQNPSTPSVSIANPTQNQSSSFALPEQNQTTLNTSSSTDVKLLPEPFVIPPANNEPGKNVKKRNRRRQRRRNKKQQQAFANLWYNQNNSNNPDNSKPAGVETPAEEEEEVEKVENVPEALVEENYFEEVEVASVEAETKHEVLVGYRKTKQHYLSYKKKCFFRPKIFGLAERTFVNCLNMHEDIDVDVVSEAEYEYENEHSDKNELQEMSRSEVEEEANKIKENDKVSKRILRNFKTCVENCAEITREKSLIQESLDTWKSHLLGLEYLIEVQNESKDSVIKYHCVLCDKDLNVQGIPSIFVTSHINDCKHIVSYLVKHFSTYGFKVSESSTYDTDTLKKICEDINREAGYYSMCVTNLAYYTKNSKDIKGKMTSAYHANGDNVKLDKSLVQKALNFHLLEEIKNVLCDIINEVELHENDKMNEVDVNNAVVDNLQSDTKSLENTADTKNPNRNASQKDSFRLKRKKMAYNTSKSFPRVKSRFSRSFPKGKGSSAFSTYLKSKYAKSSALYKKPLKGLSSHLNKESTGTDSPQKNEMDEEEDGTGNNSVKETTEMSTEEISTEEASEMSAEEASDMIVEDASKITVKEDSKMIAEESSKAIVREDSEMSVKDAFKMSVKDSSKVSVKDASKISDKDASKISDKDASKISDKDASKIIDKDASKMSVKNTSKESESDITDCSSSQHAHKSREKVSLKTTTVHSKHCRKRILGKENSRSKPASKTSTKEELTSDVSNKVIENCKFRSRSTDHNSSSKITKKHDNLGQDKTGSRSTQKKGSPHRSISAHKSSKDLKLVGEKHSGSHRKISSKKSAEDLPSNQINVVRDSSSEWRPIVTSKSPVKSPISGSSSLSKSPSRRNVRKHSKSPIRRVRNISRQMIREPLRIAASRYSRSPVRKSRSPLWKSTKSPVRRKSRSPLWKPTRSPVRKKSRTPPRRYSKSPVRRRSRSPVRRHSKSPRRYSRSPRRRRSRSPVKRRSRSPVKRHSRSPLRRHSRSPLRRRSRSPVRRRSRSPVRRYSRSPLRRHSRSPLRKRSRSPVRRRSRSPIRRHSRSPVHKLSDSPPKYRNLRKAVSPSHGKEHFDSKLYGYNERIDSHMSEFSKISRESSKIINQIKNEFKSHQFSSPMQGISDLDPVSDEDESVYFNDKLTDISSPSSSKMVVAKLLQKFSTSEINPNDPAVNKLMQFMESHSAEIQDLMGSHSKSGNSNVNKVDSNLQERNLLLQQYLLNLAGVNQEQGLAAAVTSNLSSNFPQQSFLQVLPGFRLNMPPNVPPNIPPSVPLPNPPPPNVSQPVQQQRFFPPNINVPPPQLFHQVNQPRHNFSPKPNVPPEIMFKDLKATVNKLFGANEAAIMKQEKMKPQVPGYVTEPDPEKWDLNHPDTQKFNASIGSKNMFLPQRKNVDFNLLPKNPVREDIPVFNNNNPGPFFSGRGGMNRPQIPNVSVPPPDAKVSFCDVMRSSAKGNLFPVVNNPLGNSNYPHGGVVSDHKLSLAQRLASVLVKFGMIDVPAPLLQEMLMKIGAFSSSPRQDIDESEIISILKRLGYLS